MSPKTIVKIGMVVGSLIGAYVPVFFGADFFSIWAVTGTALGGVAGLWVSYKLVNQY